MKLASSRRSNAAIAATPPPAQRAAGIQQLGDDLLRHVLLLIPQGKRLRAAEVCKAWNQLLQRPDMWATVYYPRVQLSYPQEPESDGTVGVHALHWLTSRRCAQQSLRIEGAVPEEEEILQDRVIDGKLQTLLLAFAAAPALAELHVELPVNLSIDSKWLLHVKLLGGLIRLHIHGISPPVTTDTLNRLFLALPALQACSLGLSARPNTNHVPNKASIPPALFSCTQLTSLEVLDTNGDACVDWGGLCSSITALQRLARLRLQNVVTAPLTDAISALTSLTSLGLYSEDFCTEPDPPLLPATVAALTGLRQLDIDTPSLPPAVAALTGMHELMLRDMKLTPAALAMLTTMRQLSRLHFSACEGKFRHGKILIGLDGFDALRQLHITDCGVAELSHCRVFGQLTELRLRHNWLGTPPLAFVAVAMPRLVILDLSHNDFLIVPNEVIPALRGCVSLRHLWCERPDSEPWPRTADTLLEVQCAVPHVRWHLRGAPSDGFDEVQQ